MTAVPTCITCKFCQGTTLPSAKCTKYIDPFNGQPLLVRVARADVSAEYGWTLPGSLCGYVGTGWLIKSRKRTAVTGSGSNCN